MFHNPLQGPIRAVSNMIPLSSGHKMPQLGFGTYQLEAVDCSQAIATAIESGFRHFDCAKMYNNQRALGTAFSEVLNKGAVKREDLFITSKLWMTEYEPSLVRPALLDTLDELGLKYLDLYLMHWPVAWKHTGSWTGDGPFPTKADGMADTINVPLQATWRELEKLVDEGLIKSIGVSNFSPAEVDSLEARHLPVNNQIELHPALQQTKLRSANRDRGIVTSAYCPLGMPTTFTPPDFKGVVNCETLGPLCEYTGFSRQKLLLSWHVDRGHAVLAKASKPAHIRENASVHRFQLAGSVTLLLNEYEKTMGKMRVVDPQTFREPRGPFFE